MKPQCCFDRLSLPIIVDTSVAINLNATAYASKIIEAIPNSIMIVDIVQEELNNGTLKGNNDANLLSKLITAGLIEVVHLGKHGMFLFERLVSGNASQSLDDGEAATIASAIEANSIALIDERKATKICDIYFPELPLACTMDIFNHPNVKSSLGQKFLADAVFNALQRARMNVHSHYIDWVIELIGHKNAINCKSLPRKIRKKLELKH